MNFYFDVQVMDVEDMKENKNDVVNDMIIVNDTM